MNLSILLEEVLNEKYPYDYNNRKVQNGQKLNDGQKTFSSIEATNILNRNLNLSGKYQLDSRFLDYFLPQNGYKTTIKSYGGKNYYRMTPLYNLLCKDVSFDNYQLSETGEKLINDYILYKQKLETQRKPKQSENDKWNGYVDSLGAANDKR